MPHGVYCGSYVVIRSPHTPWISCREEGRARGRWAWGRAVGGGGKTGRGAAGLCRSWVVAGLGKRRPCQQAPSCTPPRSTHAPPVLAHVGALLASGSCCTGDLALQGRGPGQHQRHVNLALGVELKSICAMAVYRTSCVMPCRAEACPGVRAPPPQPQPPHHHHKHTVGAAGRSKRSVPPAQTDCRQQNSPSLR